MVWAMIFFLLFSTPALAEPVEEVPIEEETGGVSGTVDEPSSAPAAAPVPLTAPAVNNSIYSSVLPNSAYVELARLYLPRIPWGSDYVFWRSGQFEYRLAFGDISWDGRVFSGGDYQYIFTLANSGYSSDVSVDTSFSPISLTPNGLLVYSSLGDFPTLSETFPLLFMLNFCLVVGLCCSVLRYIWSFLLRMGVRTHDASGL